MSKKDVLDAYEIGLVSRILGICGEDKTIREKARSLFKEIDTYRRWLDRLRRNNRKGLRAQG